MSRPGRLHNALSLGWMVQLTSRLETCSTQFLYLLRQNYRQVRCAPRRTI